MTRRLFALLCLLGTSGRGQETGARTFELTLPDNWPTSEAVYVLFTDLEVPENRPVVFRLFAVQKDREHGVGTVSLLGKSADATGTRHLERLEANITQEFRRWANEARPGGNITIRVRPFAGLKEAPDYNWSVKEIRLEVR